MGTLRTTIELQDKFSNQLNKINKSIQNTANAMNRLNSSNASSVKSVNSALSQQITQNNTILKQMGKWATQLRNIATIYFGIRGAIEGVNKAIKLSDRMTMANARLNLMADKNNPVESLEAKTFGAAQRATTDYLDFTKAVTKLGILAGDKFANQDSIIRFTELMQKQFAIGGADASERSAAMLQLTQAIASNRLQGDELRSIRENAPLLVKAIQDSLGVSEAKFKDMAKAGEITADVIIKAMAKTADEVDKLYAKLPMTWERHWAKIKNVAVMAFRPIQEQLERLFKSEKFQTFINGICTAMIVLGNIGGWALDKLFDFLGAIPKYFQKLKDWLVTISDKLKLFRDAIVAVTLAWTAYKAIQMIVVAWTKLQAIWTAIVTAAKTAFITVMLSAKLAMFAFGGATGFASMMTAIFQAILGNLAVIIGVVLVAALALFIFWIFRTSDSWIDACSRIVGGCYWMGALITNIWYGIKNIISGVCQWVVNAWDWCCNNIGTIFDNIGIWWNNLWIDARSGFYGFINDVLTKLSSLAQKIQPIAELLDIDLSGMIGKAQASITGKINGLESQKKSYKSLTPFKSVDWTTNEYKNLDDAYNKGYGKTEKFLTKVSNEFNEMKDELGKKLEDLKKVELGGEKVTADALNGLNDKLGDVGNNTGNTANNTGDIAKNTSSTEDYSYLRNWAYNKGMGNSIGYNIKIEQNNRNNVASNIDLQKLVDVVRDGIIEGLYNAAEGVR